MQPPARVNGNRGQHIQQIPQVPQQVPQVPQQVPQAPQHV